MAAINVMIWNIQDYGCVTPRATFLWGPDQRLRNHFIAMYMMNMRVDLLIIQEAKPTSDGALRNLREKLEEMSEKGETWAVSRCGSAYEKQVQGGLNGLDVKYKTGGRVEGYAVVWRTNHPNFQLAHNLGNIADFVAPAGAPSPLNLSSHGRYVTTVDDVNVYNMALREYNLEYSGKKRGRTEFEAPRAGSPEDGFDPGPDFTNLYPTYAPTAYPGSDGVKRAKGNSGNEAAATGNYDQRKPWMPLILPGTGKWDGTGIVRGSRRPAYVVMIVNGTQVVPVMAYHAPSEALRAQLGVQFVSMSREFYVVDELQTVDGRPAFAGPMAGNFTGQLSRTHGTIMGGDFNFGPTDDVFPESNYQYFQNQFRQSKDGGANCPSFAPDIDPERPEEQHISRSRMTSVRLGVFDPTTKVTTEIYGTSTNDYLAMPIDLVFARQLAGCVAPECTREDLLPDLLVGKNQLWGKQKERYLQFFRVASRHLQQLIQRADEQRRRRNWAQVATPAGALVNGDHGPGLLNDDLETYSPLVIGSGGSPVANWAVFFMGMCEGKFSTARSAAEFYRGFVSDHLPMLVEYKLDAAAMDVEGDRA